MTDIVTKHTEINYAKGAADDALRVTDNLSKAVQKTVNRVSMDIIKAKIDHVDYWHPDRHPHMTICLITMKNGFVVLGKSAPADPLNYDADLGAKFAYEDAFRQIWPLEAYLLREQMTKE